MLVIRNSQLEQFQQNARQRFVDHAITRLAADYPGPGAALGESGLRRLVESAITKGKSHGVVTEGAVLILAGLMLQYGDAFERSPSRAWAEGVLEDPALPGQVKMEMLLQRMAAKARGRVVVQVEN